ncbi:MAG: methyltransferase domain-containing protein [Pirellulales bacterium]|nr:methyltransferase domain-containing protein [Pirellulales bacterium]
MTKAPFSVAGYGGFAEFLARGMPDMSQWYETLFANFGRSYDKEVYTQGTVGEVDFVERELGGDRSKRILDIGCGTGRHAVELARRGYDVTGFDLAEGQLRVAREKADAAGVTIGFQRRDATEPHFDQEFDAAILFCGGAFPLMETDEKNHAILLHAAAALRPQGKLIMTTLNALFPLYHSVKDFIQANEVGSTTSEVTFDLMTFREHSELTFTDDAGVSHTLKTNERYYTPAELRWLLRTAGFSTIDIFGSHLGEFSRDHALTPDDFEMLVVAEKGE